MPKVFNITPDRALVPFGKHYIHNQICEQPYTTIEVDINGEVALCACADWMPSKVGNIFENSLTEILSNKLSQEIRRSMRESTFDYCNPANCGSIKNNLLTSMDTLDAEAQALIRDPSQFLMPSRIWFAGDRTCNLSCPSCRTSVIKNKPEQVAHLESLGQQIYKNLFSSPTDREVTIHTSTSGEVFASPLILGFINSINLAQFPNTKLALQTNGVLAKARWHRLGAMADQVTAITVTTDATKPDTYKILRRGGDWDQLQESLQWIAQKRKSQPIWLSMRMVVQAENFDQIEEFYHQSIALGADTVEYCRLQNWGTYSLQQFVQQDVFAPEHPQYQEACAQLFRVQTDRRVRLFGNLPLPIV